MAFTNRIGEYSHSGGAAGAIGRSLLRLLQFALALTVAGLYGIDLHHGHEAHVHPDRRWVYAEVVAGLSAISCIVYAVPFIKSFWFFAWDFVLFILWTALFGIFGKMYIHDHPTPEQKGQIRMKHAVWVDLTNMFLWLITFVWGLSIWFANRRNVAARRPVV